MGTRIRLRSIAPGIGSEADEAGALDRVRESSRPEWSIPDDPREQRRIRNRLIALALALPIARLLQLLFH